MRPDFENLYHQVETEHWWFVGRRDLLTALLRAEGATPESRILDVGCSAGATLRHLQGAGYRHVVGIDISAEAIERCRRAGLQQVYAMDAQAPDFPHGSFDVILASDILEHVSDEGAAAGAWFHLLRPRGVLIALVPAFMALWSGHDEANHHRKRYRLGELRACLERAGFETQRASYWNFLLFMPAAALRLIQRTLPGRAGGTGDLELPAAPSNRLLAAILRGENRLLEAGLAWPWGLSALVVARRPAADAIQTPLS
jgi:SAM-dependent methyltransferase